MNTTKHYVVLFSREQLQGVQLALEVLARLQIGQIGPALDEMLNNSDKSRCFDYEIQDKIERLIKPYLDLERNQSWGVGKFKSTDTLWDMYEVIRNRMAWDQALESGRITQEEYDQRIPDKDMWSNQYDTPMHWNKDVDLVKIFEVPIERVSRLNEFFD